MELATVNHNPNESKFNFSQVEGEKDVENLDIKYRKSRSGIELKLEAISNIEILEKSNYLKKK